VLGAVATGVGVIPVLGAVATGVVEAAVFGKQIMFAPE
jgi:hypothetical protein